MPQTRVNKKEEQEQQMEQEEAEQAQEILEENIEKHEALLRQKQ